MGWIADFTGSTIGKKIIVAVTGALLSLFLVAHVLGNLLAFEGRGPTPETTKLNEYAELIRVEPALLWAARLGLLVLAVLHVTATVQLTARNRASRRHRYARRRSLASTLASRTMIYGGIALLGFIVYHILHLTTGTAHSGVYEQYGAHDVYSRVVASFQNPWITLVYVVSMVFLFFHLKHGLASAGETLGVSHPRYLALFRRGGPVLAFLLILGFISVPAAVWLGLID